MNPAPTIYRITNNLPLQQQKGADQMVYKSCNVNHPETSELKIKEGAE